MEGQQTLIVRAPAKLGTMSTMVDGTIKGTIYISKELPDDEMTTLFKLAKQGEGWFIFSPNPIDEAAIPKEKADAQFDGKSPSERMYNTLYVRWRELTNQSEPFDVYYANQMNKLIALLKQDLPGRS